MAKFIKPTEKALDTLIDQSEQYNTPYAHHEIIMQLTTMDAKSVSFAISKLQEKNEYGRPANRLNSTRIRNINVGISKDPMKYEEYSDEINNNKKSFEAALGEKFKKYIQNEETYSDAMIVYITLKKEAFFKNTIEKNKEKSPLKEWLVWYSDEDKRLTERIKKEHNHVNEKV